MLGVLCEVTHRSASTLSMVTLALASSPRNRPTCTSTRVTAKAMPERVMTKRSLSWKRFLRAKSTIASALPRDAANDDFGHVPRQLAQRSQRHERIVLE